MHTHGDTVPLFGPLPGVRADDTLAHGFELSSRFTPMTGLVTAMG